VILSSPFLGKKQEGGPSGKGSDSQWKTCRSGAKQKKTRRTNAGGTVSAQGKKGKRTKKTPKKGLLWGSWDGARGVEKKRRGGRDSDTRKELEEGMGPCGNKLFSKKQPAVLGAIKQGS